MKTTILLCACVIFCLPVFSQKTFCEGWEDGYDAGKRSMNDKVYTVPICPIARINQDTYEMGYSRGYEKATGDKSTTVPATGEDSGDPFCDGWEQGYRAGMAEHNRSSFIVPVCPISGINESGSFDAGYLRGYQKALDKLGVDDLGNIIKTDDGSKTFCQGWEDGYRLGIQEWAVRNDKTVPARTIPICPVPKLNADNYQSGVALGKARAKEDMDDR